MAKSFRDHSWQIDLCDCCCHCHYCSSWCHCSKRSRSDDWTSHSVRSVNSMTFLSSSLHSNCWLWWLRKLNCCHDDRLTKMSGWLAFLMTVARANFHVLDFADVQSEIDAMSWATNRNRLFWASVEFWVEWGPRLETEKKRKLTINLSFII